MPPIHPLYISTNTMIPESEYTNVEKEKLLKQGSEQPQPFNSFPLPSRERPKQGFIPLGLMKKVQERHAKAGDSDAYSKISNSIQLSQMMSEQRKETYFPLAKDQ